MSRLSLIAYESLTQSQGLYAREFVDDLTANHDSYNHVISAVGGFDTASFTLGGTSEYLDDWLNDGLMRRIVCYNPEGIPAWEGLVSQLELTAGSLKKTRSIDQLYNRIYMRYSPLDTSVSPPLESAPTTLIFNDISSQLDFGVKAAIISGGGRVDATAFDWGRTVLRESKDIKVGESVNTGATEAYTLHVSCLGYYHTLKWLPYFRACSGQIQAHQVLQEVLTYFNGINPGWLSQNFGLMDYNFARARRCYSDYDKTCWDVIEKELIAQGGVAGERWVGGIYQDRQFIYKAAEAIDGLYADEFELYRALSDQGQIIYDAATGAEVKPWDMLPDRVLHTVDVNVGGDRDLMYIEQVRFSEPYGLELVGGDDQRLQVFLARRGLSGV